MSAANDAPPFEPALAAEAAPILAAAQGRRVVVWGAGLHGRWLMGRLGEAGIAFVDANPVKQGTRVLGRPVHDPDALGGLAFDRILVAVLSDHGSIAADLAGRGLVEGVDFDVVFRSGKRRQFAALLPRYLDFLGGLDLRGRTVLEVGGGGQYLLALTLAAMGAERVLATDAAPCPPDHFDRARPELDAFARSRRGRDALDWVGALDRIEAMAAPVSASAIALPDGSVDCVVSTGVMEHVSDPEGAIREAARVLRAGGRVAAMAIGIHDHRANDPDSGFSKWDFLEIPAAEWRGHAGNRYHQNRWRAVDFRRCLERHGFVVERWESVVDPGLTEAEIVRFQPEFRTYSRTELAEFDLWLTARRP